MTPELAQQTFVAEFPNQSETGINFWLYDSADLDGQFSAEQLRLIADLIEQLRTHRGA